MRSGSRSVPLALIAATLLTLASPTPASPNLGRLSPDSLFSWSFDGQTYLYAAGLERTPNSLLNPGNRVARLPNLSVTGELRPNAKATSTYIDLVVQPRLSSVYLAGGRGDSEESVRGYIHQAYMRLKPNENLSITAGRELLAWGPAVFRSPSDPYYFNNRRLDPIAELSGIDVARVSYAAGPDWTISGGAVFDSGHELVTGNPYRGSVMLKADYVRNDYLGSLVVASLRHQATFVGGSIQATVSDSTLLYGEVGSSNSAPGREGTTPENREVLIPGTSSHRSATALAGGSYTLDNGQSLYLEYLYNGYGYSRGELRQYFAAAKQANDQLLLGGSLAGLDAESIGYAATRAQDLLGQHYLYAQYQNNPAQGDTLWRLMFSHNLTDHSSQIGFYLEQNVADRISLFALGMDNTGPRGSDYGSLFRFSVTAGAKVFLF